MANEKKISSSNKAFYDEKDLPKFKQEKCNTCKLKTFCFEEHSDNNRWFLMCPHYFNWKLDLPKTFIEENVDWEREHPEEAAAKHKREVERAKTWRASQKKKKNENNK